MAVDQLKQWAAENAAILVSAVSGAALQVMVAWQHPRIAVRHFLAASIAGFLFGPAVYRALEIVTPFTGESVKSGVIGAVALGGVYAAEGVLLWWRRWSENPSIPFPWRKP